MCLIYPRQTLYVRQQPNYKGPASPANSVVAQWQLQTVLKQLREAVFNKTLFMGPQTWILYIFQVPQSIISPALASKVVIAVLSLSIPQDRLSLAQPGLYSSFPPNIGDLI